MSHEALLLVTVPIVPHALLMLVHVHTDVLANGSPYHLAAQMTSNI